MFITRASRHDKADVQEMWEAEGFAHSDVSEGKIFIARDGKVVGTTRMIEVAPQVVIVDDVVVRTDRREEGIGRGLMQAAMNSIGGKLYLCCHGERVGFYSYFGFTELPKEELPEAVSGYFTKRGHLDPPEDHPHHHFLTAR